MFNTGAEAVKPDTLFFAGLFLEDWCRFSRNGPAIVIGMALQMALQRHGSA